MIAACCPPFASSALCQPASRFHPLSALVYYTLLSTPVWRSLCGLIVDSRKWHKSHVQFQFSRPKFTKAFSIHYTALSLGRFTFLYNGSHQVCLCGDLFTSMHLDWCENKNAASVTLLSLPANWSISIQVKRCVGGEERKRNCHAMGTYMKSTVITHFNRGKIINYVYLNDHNYGESEEGRGSGRYTKCL